jgi:hypothetical protein
MPLVLERNEHSDGADRFHVLSGKAVISMLMRVPTGEKGWLDWAGLRELELQSGCPEVAASEVPLLSREL